MQIRVLEKLLDSFDRPGRKTNLYGLTEHCDRWISSRRYLRLRLLLHTNTKLVRLFGQHCIAGLKPVHLSSLSMRAPRHLLLSFASDKHHF